MQDNHSGNPQPSQDELGGKDRTTIAVGDTQVPLAAQDAGAIKAALIDYLTTWNGQDRDALLRDTASDPAWIDSDGDLRIGAWLLEADQEHLFLMRREPSGKYAGRAHVAHLGKTDKGHWVVRRIEIERIRVR
jgi:hypothetical protein